MSALVIRDLNPSILEVTNEQVIGGLTLKNVNIQIGYNSYVSTGDIKKVGNSFNIFNS